MENKVISAKELIAEKKLRLKKWITFYRLNMDVFITHYLAFPLKPFQMFMIYHMNLNNLSTIVASRGTGKSFLSALYAVAKAILFPGSKIIIVSGTKEQSDLIITEKIDGELMKYPNIAKEIKAITNNSKETAVHFHNGSKIMSVKAKRGYRANVIVYDEFRLIKEETKELVIKPYLTFMRKPPFMHKEEYSNLVESPAQIFISSAWYTNTWMHQHNIQTRNNMLTGKKQVFMAADYHVGLENNITNPQTLEEEKRDKGATAFALEYENKMLGNMEGSYFGIDLMQTCRSLNKAFYANDIVEFNNWKTNMLINKNKDEIRLIGMDIALKGGVKNDATIFTMLRLIPKNGFYERQLVGMEMMEGTHAKMQCIRLHQLYDDFKADYCVIDRMGVGLPMTDMLSDEIYDSERGITYEPWTSMNDKELQERSLDPNAKQIYYSVTGSLQFNDLIAKDLKECLVSKKLKLLIDPILKKYEIQDKKISIEESTDILAPYAQTDALIAEMTNLEYSVKEGKIVVKERSNMRKDRYSSLAYVNYYATILENKLKKKEEKKPDISAYFFGGKGGRKLGK